MTKSLHGALIVLIAATLAAPALVDAQTFTVDKFDIKGDGGTDYLAAEPGGTGRVFVSRSTHVMIVDGASGKVLADMPNTPGVHGIGFAPKAGHGFTTNSGDQTVTMFDLKTLAVVRQIKVGPGLDGIMYDEADDKIILTNHSRPIGTLTALDPRSGDIVATVNLEDTAPEGAAADGKGRIFVNNEGTSTIQVIDVKTWKAIASWPLAPCEGPTGIAYDRTSNRIFSGCDSHSVVVDAATGKVVASIANGTRVDALGWDPDKRLIFIPNGAEGTVTVVHQDAPDTYSVVATVTTTPGAKTIAVDPVTHREYVFQPQRGPAPPAAEGTAAPAPGRGRAPQGPIVAAWFVAIHAADRRLEPGPLALAQQTAGAATPPEPAHTGFRSLFAETGRDFKAFPRRRSTWAILAIGGATAALVHPFDDNVNQRLSGSPAVGRFFAPGKYIGSVYVQAGTAVGLYAIGRYVMPHAAGQPKTNKVSHLGFDLLRAVGVSQALTQVVKNTARRDRPTGECCAFPSGHASAAFATASVFERHLGYRAALPTFAIAAYVAASRLHDNRHWLSDVVAGGALGMASGWTVVGRHGRSTYALMPVPVRGGIAVSVTRMPDLGCEGMPTCGTIRPCRPCHHSPRRIKQPGTHSSTSSIAPVRQAPSSRSRFLPSPAPSPASASEN